MTVGTITVSGNATLQAGNSALTVTSYITVNAGATLTIKGSESSTTQINANIKGNGTVVFASGKAKINARNASAVNRSAVGCTLIVDGGELTVTGGAGNDGNGISGSVTANGGTLTVTGGKGGNGGAGIRTGTVTLSGGALSVLGGVRGIGINDHDGSYGDAFSFSVSAVTVTDGYTYTYTPYHGSQTTQTIQPVEGVYSYSFTMPRAPVTVSAAFSLLTYTVNITPGANMTKTSDSGDAQQTGLTGAMTPVVYTAGDGYYFPTDYSVAAVNGIGVTRDSYTQITVSGTPTAYVEIALTAPTAKTKEATPARCLTPRAQIAVR